MDLRGVRQVPGPRLGHDHRRGPESPRGLLQPGPRDQAQQVSEHQPALQVLKSSKKQSSNKMTKSVVKTACGGCEYLSNVHL